MKKLSYPNDVVGQGFRYVSPQTGAAFQHINIYTLHEQVVAHLKANNLTLNNDEFEDNVCNNTPNVVCTESTRGVGDLFSALAQPVARLVDAVAGTELQGCGGCLKRKHQMNG